MWVNSVSWLVKAHFQALMGQIQAGILLLALHCARESLRYSDYRVGEQCFVLGVG